MTITVRFFANVREAVGTGEIEIEKTENLKSLLDKLILKFGNSLNTYIYAPGTRELRGTITIMINGRGIRFLQGIDTPLKDGDVVAIFPPVAGG